MINNKPTLYRVSHVLVDLDWDDFDFQNLVNDEPPRSIFSWLEDEICAVVGPDRWRLYIQLIQDATLILMST